tara:strand:- start:888 stop:1157 length:270 start_codon:yes stop_codon:yes gene_type:complete
MTFAGDTADAVVNTGSVVETAFSATNGYIRLASGNNNCTVNLAPVPIFLEANDGIQIRGRQTSGFGATGTARTKTNATPKNWIFIRKIS